MRILTIGCVVIALLSPVGACAARADQQQRDSSGVLIVESSSREARAPFGWRIDPVPNLDIGMVDGPAAYEFHRIDGIAQLADGRILVVDDGSAELRFFDRSGKFLRKSGGRGSGPGEFRSVALVASAFPDSLLLFDSRAGRFTRFDEQGGRPRTLPAGRLNGNPIGFVRDRVLLFHTIFYFGKPEGAHTQPASFLLFDLETGKGDTIGRFPGREMYVSLQLNELPTHLPIPFDVMPSAAVSGTGFFITAGEGPEIVEYDVRGQKRRIIRLDEPAQRVSREEFDRWAQVVATRHARDASAIGLIKRVYLQMPIPKIKPSFQALMVDAAGWLWAELYRVDDEAAAVWMVFDREGKARGTVAMPGGLEVFQIGRDYVLGRWRDDLSVEHVRRYALKRSN
jgi:hypothetical protein